MADIIDVITRLSLEVSDDALKRQIKTFNDLNKQVENYNFAIKQGAKDDVTNQKALQAELTRTKTARDNVGKAIIDNVNNSKKAQEVIKNEIKSINDLTSKLDSLKRARNASTDPQALAIYKKSIADTQRQLTDLKSDSVGGSIFGAGGILGSLIPASQGAIGSQLFNGVLRGFGIGSGFGIVTRLTDEIIKLGEAFFDTDKKEKEIEETTKNLNDDFSKTIDELNKFQDQYVTLNDITLDGLKNIAIAEKAKGLVQGKVNEENIRNLNAEQAVRIENQKILASERKTLDEISNFISSKKSLNDYLRDKGNSFEDPGNINTLKAVEKLTKEAADKKINLDELITEKTAENTKKSEELKTEIEAKNTEYRSKLAEEEYELNRTLLIALRKDEEQYNIQRLKAYDETAEQIRGIINIERNEALKEVDDEIDIAQKKGIYTTQIAADYAAKKAEINQKYNLQLIEQYKDFVNKYTKIGDDIERIVIKSQPGSLTALLNPEKPDLDKQVEIAGAKNKALLSEFDTYAENLQQRAIKNEVTQLEIDKELGDKKLILQKQINENLIQAYFDYYKQIEKLTESNANEQISALRLGADSQKEKRSFDLLKRKLSPKDYQYLNQRGSILNSIQTNQVSAEATKTELSAAYNVQSQLQNNPNAIKSDIDAANAEVNRLEDKLATINTSINEEKVNLNKLTIDHIFTEIDAYKQLADSAISAYQAINAAHERYLDAEISIQTQRVSEAQTLADRGNTTYLKQQQDILNKEQLQKEIAAKRELEINVALTESNEILAVSKAIAEGATIGGAVGAAIEVAAVLALIISTYSSINSLSSGNTKPIGFKGGGFTGRGNPNDVASVVHKEEFVFDAPTTAKFRPLFEHVHKYGELPIMTETKLSSFGGKSNNEVVKKLDEITDAVRESKMHQDIRLDRHGLSIMTQEFIRRDNNRFRNG